MKTYELTYIASPEMTSEELEAKAKSLESAIQSREGVIIKQSNPVAKTLSYQIKKRASGFLGFIEFQLEPEKLIEFKAILEKDSKIVRHMLIVKEAAEMKKERRTRGAVKAKTAPTFTIEQKVEVKAEEPASIIDTEEEKKEKPASKIKEVKEKVELKDIEHELDEILGE